MASFSELRPGQILPAGYILVEEAFHRLGEQEYEDWNRETALRHDNQPRPKEPSKQLIDGWRIMAQAEVDQDLTDEEVLELVRPEKLAEVAENARAHNERLYRYRATLDQLLNLFRTSLQAHALCENGAKVAINQDSWNSIYAEDAISRGAIHIHDGFIVARPTAWQRQAALKGQGQLPQYAIVLVKADDLAQRITPKESTQAVLKRAAREKFEEFLDDLVRNNIDNPITARECRDMFHTKYPEVGKNLTLNASKKIRRFILEKHGASHWMRAGRPKKDR